MRRMLAILLAAVLAMAGLSGCGDKKETGTAETSGGSESGEKKDASDFKVGLSMNVLVHPSYITMAAEIRKGCEYLGYEYVCTDPQESLDKQISDIEDLAAQGCDVIFVNTYDPDVLTPVINNVAAQGIRVIAVDNALSDEAQLATTIQADNHQNGVLVGNYVADTLKGQDIKIVCISGAKGAEVSRVRRSSFIEGIVEEQLRQGSDAKVEIVAQAYTEWFADATVTAMEDIMALNEEFNVVFAEADVMAIECYKILQDAGLLDKVMIVADADGQKEAFELIKEGGAYKATGLNSMTLLGQTAVETAQKIQQGETSFPYRTYTPSACVTIDNVDEYYDPDSAF